MNPEVLAYPFLFVAIFFESFILVTLLSAPARYGRARRFVPGSITPSVAIVVPCFNEAVTLTQTTESLLALHYPTDRLSVILVNDGSKDDTAAAMAKFAGHPQVRIIHKENGGKHTALNAGIAVTDSEIVGCLDADSFVESDALAEIIPCFEKQNVAAVTAAMSVAKPSTILQHMQNAEYIFGITVRHVLSSVNGLYVTPGPFSLYRREIVVALGGFRSGHQTEDMEMALRLQKHGFAIENAPRARVYTKTPRTLMGLIRQRTRWTSGFLRNVLGEYRDLVGNARHGALGCLVLPVGLVSIFGAIVLFSNSLFLLARHALAAPALRSGVPLSYSLVPSAHTLDWFYAPLDLFPALALLTVLAAIALIAIGKRLSRTPGSLTLGLLSYLLLYGVVAPLWLMRATADVVTGTHRSWR
ncbi:glycosyltransferase [Candidatus Kaiserbacteria bacterium]|nr:glycosyltransferase [Candidatus Kaiserbacteria bacterium]